MLRLIGTKLTKEELKVCFDNWFDELRNYISYRCYDSELATDLVQESFLKIWEKQLEYQGEKTKSLLYKITNELWISHYRKQLSEKKYARSLTFKICHNATEEALYYEELKGEYEQALKKLSEKKRTVFLLNRLDGLTYQEIAQRLNISTKAVEKRMKLALQDLRKYLNHEK